MLIWMIVAAYLLLILGIGIYSARRIKSSSDYLVAGRRLGPFVLAGTLAATCIDGGSTVGVVASTYGKWGASALWYGISSGLALLLLGVVAPKLRRTRVKTVPEYFRVRYGRTAGFLESVLTIISMIGMTAGQLKVSASIVEVMLGMDYNTALLVVSVLISLYAMVGGMWGVALTDVLQLIMVVLGMCLAIPFTLRLAGGWERVASGLGRESMSLTAGIGGWGQILGYLLLFFMAYACGEEVISAYYGAENSRSVRLGSVMSGVMVMLFSAVPVVLGLAIRELYQSDSLTVGVMQALDQSGRYALPALAVTSMPPAVTGILFAGILSATMSSADSTLLGAGSVYSNDIYQVFVRPDADGRRAVAVARVAIVLTMTASFITAIYAGDILSVIVFSLALRAVGTFFPYIFGHIWKRASWQGCLASLIAGTTSYLLAVRHLIYIPTLNSIFPAVVVSAIAFFFFSWLFPCRTEEEPKTERS